MSPVSLSSGLAQRLLALSVCGVLTLGSRPASSAAPVSPAVSATDWPDPTLLPERQCRGQYADEDLERFIPRAKLTLWLPGTRRVAIDPTRHCITILVEGIGDARLAELVIRGVAVPRRAVFLQLDRAHRST
jgi:hypothetical protein